jgi:hypothetical protein
LQLAPWQGYILPVPAPKKPDDRQFKVGDKISVNLHHGKIEDALVSAVIQETMESNCRWMFSVWTSRR